jgi:hypothetical protein
MQMLIMSTVSYLPESFKDAYRRFKDLPSPPSFVTMKGPYSKSEIGSGLKLFVLYEFDQSKMQEAYEFVANRMGKFVGVPGFTYSIDVLFEPKDAALKPFGDT